MKRRTLLVSTVPPIVGSAGCLDGVVDGGDPNESETDDGVGDENDESEEDKEVKEGDGNNENGDEGGGNEETRHETRFEVLGVDESEAAESATVEFEDRTITVVGTVVGNNGCYTARLGGTTIEEGTLVVRVESYEDADEDEVCTQALVGIDYESVIEFDGEPPAVVRVEHNGETVATERRS